MQKTERNNGVSAHFIASSSRSVSWFSLVRVEPEVSNVIRTQILELPLRTTMRLAGVADRAIRFHNPRTRPFFKSDTLACYLYAERATETRPVRAFDAVGTRGSGRVTATVRKRRLTSQPLLSRILWLNVVRPRPLLVVDGATFSSSKSHAT